jgi:hypothetical protein
MKKYIIPSLALAAFAVFAVSPARADNMGSIAIAPATGVVTLSQNWSIGSDLAGFHHMAQDLPLTGSVANNFYSISAADIPDGGDVSAFAFYIAASGAATNHADIGSKLSPNFYSGLTSADPDVSYGAVNMYFIHRKGTTDYFSVIVPGSGAASAVDDLKPMSGPGGPSTVTGEVGYFGLTFAAADLGYGSNLFYYLRSDPSTGFTKFGLLEPALLGTSADQFDLGLGGHNALAFTGTDVGYGTDKMYFLRLDPVTGFTILGTLDPLTGKASDIANLGSVFSTLTFSPTDLGFGTNQFYTTGEFNPAWQTVSFAAIDDRAISDGSFTVHPTASSGLPVTLKVVTGSATISGPVGGVFTVTPTARGRITLQATQIGQTAPTPYEYNMLRQSFTATGGTSWDPVAAADFNSDGSNDILWQNMVTGQVAIWLMDGTVKRSPAVDMGFYSTNWRIVAAADFDGNGSPDIVWQDSVSGQSAIWLMDGTVKRSGGVDLGTRDIAWRLAAAADFNRDGSPDIVWHNMVTGKVVIWLMDGTAKRSVGVDLGFYDTNWKITAAADFDGNDSPDIVWQNVITGKSVMWPMDATKKGKVGITLGSRSPEWRFAIAADFDGDMSPDIVWQNMATGQSEIWLMDGTVKKSGGVDLGTR